MSKQTADRAWLETCEAFVKSGWLKRNVDLWLTSARPVRAGAAYEIKWPAHLKPTAVLQTQVTEAFLDRLIGGWSAQ